MLLTALLSFSQQEFRLTEDLIEAPDQEVVFKPLGIIVGEAYRENLFVAIQQNPQRMGLYNEQKEEILPIIYDEVYSGLVNPHYVVVVENRLKGLFDVQGRRVCESIYSGFTLSPSDSTVIGAYLGRQEKWRVIDNKGERVFPEDYTKIEFLQKGLVILQNEDYKGCLASVSGELVTPFEFEGLQGVRVDNAQQEWYEENDIVARAILGLGNIYLNSKGEIVNK